MIKLERTGEIIAMQHVVYTGLFEQAWGLRFASQIDECAYVFMMPSPRKIFADNLFVFFDLDMVWLDADMRVIDIDEYVPPFALWVGHKGKALCLIEFAAGVVSEYGIKKGDVLHLDNGK